MNGLLGLLEMTWFARLIRIGGFYCVCWKWLGLVEMTRFEGFVGSLSVNMSDSKSVILLVSRHSASEAC